MTLAIILLALPRPNALATYLDGSQAWFHLANCHEIAAQLDAMKHVSTRIECR